MLLRTSRPTTTRATTRATGLAATALAVALAASACSGGSTDDDEPEAGRSSEAPEGSGSPSDAPSATEDTAADSPDPSETTPPGTSLEADGTAVVDLAALGIVLVVVPAAMETPLRVMVLAPDLRVLVLAVVALGGLVGALRLAVWVRPRPEARVA